MKYRNYKEEMDRVTDRSTRRLIKLYSVDDPDLQLYLGGLQARIDELQGHRPTNAHPILQGSPEVEPQDIQEPLTLRCQCCCRSHCEVSMHNLYGSRTYYHPVPHSEVVVDEGFPDKEEQLDEEEENDESDQYDDNVTAYILSVGRRMDERSPM